MTLHEAKLSTMTAAWLLPIVSTIVAAASGGIVADVLPNPQHALWTLTVSYILWGTGVPLAMFTLVLYFQRLTMHSLPPQEVIVSVFLPLGPLGQGVCEHRKPCFIYCGFNRKSHLGALSHPIHQTRLNIFPVKRSCCH